MKLLAGLVFVGALSIAPLRGQQLLDGRSVDILRNPPLAAGSAPSRAPRTYGTTTESLQRIGLSSFAPASSTQGYAYTDGSSSFTRYSLTAGNQSFTAHPMLPSGAIVTGVDFDVCDSNPVSEIIAAVLTTDRFGQNVQTVLSSVTTSGTPGCATLFDDLSAAGLVVDNLSSQIILDIVLSSGDTTNSFAGATIHYLLQVSPPPATADFADVPTNHPFFQFVEALYHAGITAGCGGGNFCPDNPLTRGQMAVFLAKGLGLQFP
jgi:hypothetical protein